MLNITPKTQNPNFNGTFLINYRKALPGTKTKLEEVVGKNGKLIFENYAGNPNNILYVLKNSKDYDVAHFVKRNELTFKYLPGIDTRLRFETEDEAKRYIKNNKPQIIETLKDMLTFVEENRLKNRAKKDSNVSYVDKILKAINLDIKGSKTRNASGVTTICDKENEGLVLISPQSKFNINYVYVDPPNKYEDAKRYAIDADGNILATFNTPDGIKTFNEKFKKAINHHLHIPEKK